MRYFLDTEFIEDGKTIDLISIGIVCEDGRELYLGNKECDFSKASKWVRDNVLYGKLLKNSYHYPQSRFIDESLWKSRREIAYEVAAFFGAEEIRSPEFGLRYALHHESSKPEIWAYYADYDWVVFCWLFGTMMDLPEGFPMYCRDIKQECDRLGNPDLPKQGKDGHNALADARWCKSAWEFLRLLDKLAPFGYLDDLKEISHLHP